MSRNVSGKLRIDDRRLARGRGRGALGLAQGPRPPRMGIPPRERIFCRHAKLCPVTRRPTQPIRRTGRGFLLTDHLRNLSRSG